MNDFIPCVERMLPSELHEAAAATAVLENPANKPNLAGLMMGLSVAGLEVDVLPPGHLALLTSKFWGSNGVQLTVGFIDGTPADLQARIIRHMNAWNKSANVQFMASRTDPQVRVAFTPGGGYWSNLGTDILHIPVGQPTMNLDSFTMRTPESEFIRVVRHETGHTLGFPHEHMRRQLVARINPQLAYDYFRRTQGWSEAVVQEQVLKALDDSQITATPDADQNSIMTYSLPGSITFDQLPIIGGVDIDPLDYAFAAKMYPKPISVPPPVSIGQIMLTVDWQAKKVDVAAVT